MSLRWPALLLVANLLSAGLFIALSDRPVFDDASHLRDVVRYVNDGVSYQTVREHQNPTGPVAFIWMAVVGSSAGSGLGGSRAAITLCWAIAGLGLLWHCSRAQNPTPWLGALTAALVAPHAITATATMLTEGPSIALSMLGVLLWSRAGERAWMAVLGGVLIGLAVATRQYYVALLGALAGPLALSIAQRERPLPVRTLAFGFAGGALPVVALLSVWGGFSSPAMVMGLSYGGVTSKVGLSVDRPLVALFYIAAHMLPFGVPFAFQIRGRTRVVAVALATCAALVVCFFGWSWLSPGPLRSIVAAIDAGSGLGRAIVALVVFAVTYGAAGWAVAIGRALQQDPPSELTVSVAFIGLFVLEQAAVGGDIKFYERYVFQLAPFIGLLSWSIWPGAHLARTMACAALWLAGQAMLWRHL